MRRVAASAQARMRYRYSEPVMRQFAALGDRWSTLELADLMVARDQIDIAIDLLQRHLLNDSLDEAARSRLVEMIALRSKVDDLRASVDGTRSGELAELLADRGRTAALQARAHAGDPAAQDSLASLLAERSQIKQLEWQADADNKFAADRLAETLASQGQLDALRLRADRKDSAASFHLAQQLSEQGHVDELASRAAAGDKFALRRLILLAKEQPGTTFAHAHPQGHTSARDHIAELRQELALGSPHAADQLTALLLRLRLISELWTETDAGTPFASGRLVNALIAEHPTPTHLLNRLRVHGLNTDGTVSNPEEVP